MRGSLEPFLSSWPGFSRLGTNQRSAQANQTRLTRKLRNQFATGIDADSSQRRNHKTTIDFDKKM